MKKQKLKNGTEIFKQGRYKVLQIFKRPHGGYCCFIFNKGIVVSGNGYYATAFPNKYFAFRWGFNRGKGIKNFKSVMILEQVKMFEDV